jgi:hypothetical protein
MKHIRVRLSIKLNGEHVDAFDVLRKSIEAAVATNLPAEFSVDTVRVTRINEATPANPTTEVVA